MRQRPISRVPWAVPVALVLALALQALWHARMPLQRQADVALAPPPALALLRLSALGEPIALSKVLMFHVQAADSGAGVVKLDYFSLTQWLERISDLDPRAQYPMLAASHLYAEVSDETKKRRMLEFIYQRFLQDPDRRWPSLAHAALLAKHRLHDLPLAQRYAQAIRTLATGANVPSWAKQMEIFILEDMNEIESAKILLGGLLASGEVSDPQEKRFLMERLKAMAPK